MYDSGAWDESGYYRHKNLRFSNNTRYQPPYKSVDRLIEADYVSKEPVAAFILPDLSTADKAVDTIADAAGSALDTAREFIGNLF